MAKRLSAHGCGMLLALATSVGVADVVVVVSKKNSVESLTRTELTYIYLRQFDRFPNGKPAVPIDQDDGTPERTQFYRHYLGRSPAQIKAYWSKLIFTGRGRPPRSFDDGASVVDVVAKNPNAIGYVDPELVDDRVRVVPIE